MDLAELRSRSTPPPTVLLDRAMLVLSLFDETNPDWSATEVSHATRLPLPTVSRLLGQLQRLELVSRSPETQRFRLGPESLRIGRRAAAAYDPRRDTATVLRALALASSETAFLVAVGERRDTSVCIQSVDSIELLRCAMPVGTVTPLHLGASQKVLLALLDQGEQEAYLRRSAGAFTAETASLLRTELAEIAKRGTAYTVDEPHVGTWCAAAPVRSPDGIARAAVGLCGPAERASRIAPADLAAQVKAAAAELAASFG
jgi:DNA-binding IclR family transcriptional regulator